MVPHAAQGGLRPMKIVVFGPDNRTGAVCADTIVDLCRACAKYLHEREGEPHPREMAEVLVPADLARLIAGGSRALDYAQKALAYLSAQAQDQIGLDGHPLVHPAAAVRLRAPRPDNARIACAGGNFADHAAAMAARIRRRPYEGEIAIVLGRRGADLKPSQLKDYVWGVTILADWSIRAPREAAGGPLNFALSKNFDTSCALGPCIVVGEADPGDIALETFVNGERRQSFNTREMVFSFGEYLEYLSRDFTLHPGDIISSGTAAGTAADSSAVLPDGSSAPERFLKPGDLVEINAPAIGALRVRVVAKRQ